MQRQAGRADMPKEHMPTRPAIASLDAPYCSVVVAARNDDHGGNLLRRMNVFVSGLLEQCRRHQLRAELIVVEWNPPADRPRLDDALAWPSEPGPCDVRIIEVSPEIHRRFRYSEALPLFQMIAKNVGIRRARSQLVLATNIDILFSDELMAFLASGRLRSDRMYRVDRYDVPADVPVDVPVLEQLTYCRENAIRICERHGFRDPTTGRYYLRFQRSPRLVELRQRLEEWHLYPIVQPNLLHTNACGDFTLMAREHWHALRGYPEFEMYSMYIDGVLCYAAHCHGASEEILPDPMRIYHIEHGSGWSPDGEKALNARLTAAGIPQLDWMSVVSWALQMRRERKPIIFNGVDWGLAQEVLRESTPSTGRSIATEPHTERSSADPRPYGPSADGPTQSRDGTVPR